MADPSPGVAADAPDLTEAENAVRGWPFAGPSLVRVMAEYDQRGADLAEVHDALTMRSRLLAEEQAARSDVEQRLVLAAAALVQVRAQVAAERRSHVRTIDDALKVRDAWTAQHAAVLALAGELDEARHPAGVSWLHAFAARLRETLTQP